MSTDPLSNNDEVLQPTLEDPKALSTVTIAIIVISVIAGIGLISLGFLLVRRRNFQKNDDLEGSCSSPIKKRKVFHFSSTSNEEKRMKDVPVSSSLDNQEIFSTILEYPPTKPPTSFQNNLFLDVPITNNTCSSYSVYEDRRKILNANDPISASLVRQSIEERSGYYKSPTRTPVPYYQQQSSVASSCTKSNELMVDNDDDDEDRKAMQRWSASSYHVW